MGFDPDSGFVPSSRIDHIGITAPSEQFGSLVEFYKNALAPLKYRELMRFPGAVGLGDQVPDFWISKAKVDAPQSLRFAFVADERQSTPSTQQRLRRVNGKPGLRKEYHPNYYAAFIWDPRGNNVEIVRSSFVGRPVNARLPVGAFAFPPVMTGRGRWAVDLREARDASEGMSKSGDRKWKMTVSKFVREGINITR
ncbi:hypothetical protein BDW69DRAFT_183978 [Aspergillus filifer]